MRASSLWLVSAADACNGWDQARPKLGAQSRSVYYQEASLLCASVCTNRKVNEDLMLDIDADKGNLST